MTCAKHFFISAWVMVFWACQACIATALANTTPTRFAGWLDGAGTATIETVQQNANWEPFSGWKGWAYGAEPVWVKVQVPAVREPNTPHFVLIVRPPYLDKVTFYDPVSGVQKKAGDHYPVKDDALGSVLFTFEVPAQNTERNVYLQIQSSSARMVHLSLLPLPEAQAYTRFVEWATGFVLVLSLVFLSWAVVHWTLTRDRVMGIFALKQFIITLWGFLFFGFGRVTVGALFSEGTLSLVSSLAVSGLLWSGLWFFATLLRDYNARPWMLRCMRYAAITMAFLSLMHLTGLTQMALQMANATAPVLLLWTLLTLYYAQPTTYKPPIAKQALMVYLLVYAILHTLPTLMHLGLLDETPILFLGNMGLLVLDGLIMLVILSVRQRRFKEQHQTVTNQLMLQQEQARLDQQYLDEQRKLLAMLAHEMKTPLANLRIWMEAGPKGRPVMERAILDMNGVIERCVHAGQLSDHSLKPRNEWIDAAELTQSLLATSRQRERVQFKVPNDVCAIHTDAQMLSIVLSNLLENAYKYGGTDQPITLTLEPFIDLQGIQGWQWVFENTVGETGFPDVHRVFDKYYRSARAQSQSGSGLGLFLVKSLAELMRGYVRYTPLTGRLRFDFWLPVRGPDAN